MRMRHGLHCMLGCTPAPCVLINPAQTDHTGRLVLHGINMAILDDLAAVQAALEEARVSLEDLDLAYSLQQQEFFGDGNGQGSSPDSSLEGSLGGDSVGELKAAMELQVRAPARRGAELPLRLWKKNATLCQLHPPRRCGGFKAK
jgi:hypothetical protein